MAKDFKTHEQLVELMESRGIETDSRTIGILKRESYYAIVNGYKGPFLDRDAMQSSHDDVFQPGTTFSNLYDLFLFDRDLRAMLFPFLAKAESVLKNAVVYSFCERHPATSAYLERSNYVTAQNMLFPKAFSGNRAEEHGKNMATLMRILNGKLTITSRSRPFVKHYMDRYGAVPLWVLQNDLTFGNMEHFYQLQNRDVQNSACKIVAEAADLKRITPHEMLRAFTVLVEFRNMCAHDERIYCAEAKGARFDEMVQQLSVVLPPQEGEDLFQALLDLTKSYIGRVSPNVLKMVLKEMHLLSEKRGEETS